METPYQLAHVFLKIQLYSFLLLCVQHKVLPVNPV